MKDHKTAYIEWLQAVDEALVAAGKRSIFSFRKKPLPYGPDGDVPDEPGDTMAIEVDEICRKAGVQPFKWTRS